MNYTYVLFQMETAQTVENFENIQCIPYKSVLCYLLNW